MTRTIQRIPLPDRTDFYRRIVRAGEPVIFVGALDHWKAKQRWTFDWFAEQYGDAKIPVEWLRYVRDETGAAATREGRRVDMVLRDYIETTKAADTSECGYLIGTDMFDRIPELLAHLDFPRIHSSDRMVKRLFFMGAAGAYTQLHYDRADNLHAMMVGHKRWQLYGPAKSAQLDPVEPAFVWSVMSGLDLGQERMRPAAELGPVEPDYDLILEGGEMLYLPYGWWHRVVSEDATISTNFWWWTYGMLARLAPSIAPSAARIAFRQWRKRSTRAQASARP